MKHFDNRDEGTADRPHAARDYELLGFYAYRQDYALSNGVNLRLRFFLPRNEPAFVQARELTVIKQYQMRPKPEKIATLPGGWREFAGWPVSDVLKPNRIDDSNLGVIVRLNSNEEYQENLAPAILLSSAQLPAAIEEYVLYLKVDSKLRNLDYQVDGAAGYSHAYKYKENAKDRSVEGKSIIDLHFAAKPMPPGAAVLHIQGDYANQPTAKPLSITYRFYHQPL
jgi:hypothetical protein